VTSAKAQVKQAQSQLSNAQSQQTSAKGQVTTAQGSIEDAQLNLEDARTALADTKDALADAKADLAEAEENADKLTIIAPFDGIVTAIGAFVGDEVTAGGASSSGSGGDSPTGAGLDGSDGTGNASSGVITLTSLSTLEVSGSFAEADAAALAADQLASISFPALTSVTVPGTVTWISPTSSSSNSVVTYEATVRLDEIPETLRLGQTADISVTTAEAADVLTLPANAVTIIDEASGTVELQAADGSTTTTTVGVGLQGDSTIEITDGLEEGDTVLVSLDTATGGSSTSGQMGERMFVGGPGMGGNQVFRAPGMGGN
jgi:macrolide-specific efflux system membrane fusion protein